MTFPELLAEGFEPHKVREVLIMGHDNPDTWINITSTMEVAIKSLRCHVSQVGRRKGLDERMRHWRREAGQGREMEYAEAFKRFRLS